MRMDDRFKLLGYQHIEWQANEKRQSGEMLVIHGVQNPRGGVLKGSTPIKAVAPPEMIATILPQLPMLPFLSEVEMGGEVRPQGREVTVALDHFTPVNEKAGKGN